jgi:UDP-N-acetylglucosamine 2-epimerase (non-hydrolysing)
MKRILNIVGARPNFMKIAPIHTQMQQTDSIEPILIHTGQHYDERMSTFFFDDLGMPKPDAFLGVGSGSHAEQTARVMVEFEKVCQKYNPDLVLVVGDVNSTMACSITAKKLWIPVAHVEAGLRSFDREMPEEINRLATDAISDILFVSERNGEINLKNEGVDPDKMHYVGNVMIDSLIHFMEKAEQSTVLKDQNLQENGFVLVTLHRPSNVDNAEQFAKILDAFDTISKEIPIVFPIHPRAQKNLETFGLAEKAAAMNNLLLLPPLGYLDFIQLEKKCRFVITDSGGLQEETTYLGKPCLTVRENTERPITVQIGTNEIVGSDMEKLTRYARNILAGDWKKGEIPKYWDGKTAERIVKILDGRV